MTELSTARDPSGPLEARGLVVRYGDLVAVHELDLDLPPASLVSVTGPSGAGKSSLLWALAGALTPAAGEVEVASVRIVDREQAARLGVVLMPQGNALASTLTAYENVLTPMLVTGVPVAAARDRAVAALETVGLGESGNHLIEELSGGQQQRVALARSLAARARVLLADEPTSDLDGQNRERVIAALRAEADAGAVVVMATHDPEAAAQTDAEVALDEGAMSWARPLRRTTDAR